MKQHIQYVLEIKESGRTDWEWVSMCSSKKDLEKEVEK